MVRRMLAVGLLATLGVACASPTLPLPPPEDPTIGPGVDADHVKLSVPCGGANPDALIVIVNNSTTVPGDEAVSGAIVSACGSWDAMPYAHAGDYLEITQEIGTQVSQPLDLQVP
jgi:hypothetical protein